jgi:hypothetical protein
MQGGCGGRGGCREAVEEEEDAEKIQISDSEKERTKV